MDYSSTSEGDIHLLCPNLKIDKVLFNYLIRTAKAKHDKYLPEDIRKAWIEEETISFYKANKINKFIESEKIVPVPQKLIYPDDNKTEWKQSDLLREINRELLDNSNANINSI